MTLYLKLGKIVLNCKQGGDLDILSLNDDRSDVEQEDQEKRNKTIIDKVEAWQDFDYVKPLICRKTNQKLIPKLHKKSGKVVLKAPKSSYVQWSIPKVVLNTRLVVFDHAKKNKPKVKFNNNKKK